MIEIIVYKNLRLHIVARLRNPRLTRYNENCPRLPVVEDFYYMKKFVVADPNGFDLLIRDVNFVMQSVREPLILHAAR